MMVLPIHSVFPVHLCICLESLSTSSFPRFRKKGRKGHIHYTVRQALLERASMTAPICVFLSSLCHQAKAVDGRQCTCKCEGRHLSVTVLTQIPLLRLFVHSLICPATFIAHLLLCASHRITGTLVNET